VDTIEIGAIRTTIEDPNNGIGRVGKMYRLHSDENHKFKKLTKTKLLEKFELVKINCNDNELQYNIFFLKY